MDCGHSDPLFPRCHGCLCFGLPSYTNVQRSLTQGKPFLIADQTTVHASSCAYDRIDRFVSQRLSTGPFAWLSG